jgi:hypothetical protein
LAFSILLEPVMLTRLFIDSNRTSILLVAGSS